MRITAAVAAFAISSAVWLTAGVAQGEDPQVAASAARFLSGSVAGPTGAMPVRLREGQPCRSRLNRIYRQHAFVCTAEGFLQTPWQFLRRPLVRLLLAPGTPCPTPPLMGDARTIGFKFGGNLWGPGPAYPLLGADPGGGQKPVLVFRWPPPPGFGSEWSGSKVLWLVDRKKHRGRILVRGRQLDGPNGIRFEDGWPGFTRKGSLNPSIELRIEEEMPDQPATTRVRAAGCYAYQVDGRSFTYLIVFEARIIAE